MQFDGWIHYRQPSGDHHNLADNFYNGDGLIDQTITPILSTVTADKFNVEAFSPS